MLLNLEKNIYSLVSKMTTEYKCLYTVHEENSVSVQWLILIENKSLYLEVNKPKIDNRI